MGQRKTCCLCGEPITRLGTKTLKGGAKVCRPCMRRMAALPGGAVYSVFCGDYDRQHVKDRMAVMEQARDRRHQLEQLMAARSDQFTQTRAFSGSEGELIAVDDTHQLVRFNISNDDIRGDENSWPELRLVTLAIAELVDATAVTTPAVHVDSNVAGLPDLDIPVPVPEQGLSDVDRIVLAGSEGSILSDTRQDMRDQFGYQIAIQAAQFIEELITPQPAQPAEEPAKELVDWKALLDSGTITQDEFDAQKKQLLGDDEPDQPAI